MNRRLLQPTGAGQPFKGAWPPRAGAAGVGRANVLEALLFLGQGMSGSRSLLEIPLSWQKPTIQTCNFQKNSCPVAQPVAPPAVPLIR
jgi:hypothetical protein